MFSAGQVPDPNFAVSLPGGENPTGLAYPTSNATGSALSGGDIAGLSCQGGAALINAITSWACYGIQNRMQENHMTAMTEIQNIKKDMQLEAVNSQAQKMQVVEQVTKHRTAAREEHARASSERRIANAELTEQKATRKATKVDTAKLNALFSRNDRFYGRTI